MAMDMGEGDFVTVLLTYERTEKTIKGIEDEQFGWVVRISGLPQQCYPAMSSAKFILEKGQLVLTCFEETILSYEAHDQFHPPMGLVTKFLGMVVQQGYLNTSSSITAEKNEMTYCLWNFQKRIGL